MISKYIIVLIHLVSTEIAAVITQKIYLVDDLKAKMLVKMNIMSLKQINIITLKKQVIIDTY